MKTELLTVLAAALVAGVIAFVVSFLTSPSPNQVAKKLCYPAAVACAVEIEGKLRVLCADGREHTR